MHVTVAFLVVGGIVEATGLIRRRNSAERFGSTLVIAGTVSLLPTILAGFLALNSLTLSEAALAAVDRHERFGIMTLGVFLPLLIVRAWGRGKVPDGARAFYTAGLALGVALTIFVAFLGGTLVYVFGVGVK